MNESFILGKKIREIYETEPIVGEGIAFMGSAAYFSIVIELEDGTFFELGANEVTAWNSPAKLIPSDETSWAKENGLEYKNKTIQRIIHRPPEEYLTDLLTLVLENNVIIEHQTFNGDQLFIDRLK